MNIAPARSIYRWLVVRSAWRSTCWVVASCAATDAAIVLTADPDDIVALSVAVPGVRIVTRDPASPLPG
jgi:hypothetical protein